MVDKKSSRTQAARSLEINPNLITRWIKEHEQDNNRQAFRGNGMLTPEQEKFSQLRAKVRQLIMDKNILKVVTVFFCHTNDVKYLFIAPNMKSYSVDRMRQFL